MFTNDVDIDKSQAGLIKQYKKRIEILFRVSLSYVCERSSLSDKSEHGIGSSEDLQMSTIRLSSESSQKSLEKAKKYIEALTAQGTEFKQVEEEFPEQELNMLLESHNIIENESQAVLDFIDNTNRICIYGNCKNVSVAQSLIEKMREKFQNSNLCDVQLKKDFKSQSFFETYSDEMYFNNDKSDIICTKTTLMGSNNIPLTQRQDSIQMDCEPLDSFHVGTDIDHNFIDKNFESCSGHAGDIVVSPDNIKSGGLFSFGTVTSPTASPCYSDDENDEEVDQIIHDSSNRSKIEFALKLGYSQDQIAAVLRRLGSDIGQNEMLSELIRIGMTCSPSTESGEGEDSLFISDSTLPFSSYQSDDDSCDLRPIVIDGSNVAMSHGNKEIFSCQGIQLAVDWFRQRGHTQITVFVPQWRKETSRPDARITGQDILSQLEKEKILVFTPARRIGGKRVVCYDDRYVLKLAAENGGVVVSNDNYRDLINERPEYKKVVEERLLMFSFVNDRFMPPDDPLGRHGPSLDNFLSRQPRSLDNLPPLCPYGSKKCTYGNKCKYYHPERGNLPQKSVTDKLAEQAKQNIQEVRAKVAEGAEKKKQLARKPKMALQRTTSLASELPSDLVADKVDEDLKNLSLEDVIKKDTDKDEKWKQYDEKLSEHRRKLEKAEQEEKLRQDEEAKRLKDSDYLRGFVDDTHSNTPSPSNRLSPSPIRPQEQFLSGHLLLAKKLSDEANENKSRRGPEEHSYTKSPLASTQSHPVVSPPQPQPQHKKLSRQYSLQGAQDPRLRPHIRQQVSYDPNMLYQQGAYAGELYRQSSGCSPMTHQPLSQAPFYSSQEESYIQQAGYGHHRKETEGQFLVPETCYTQHMALTRMQSAPETPQHLKDCNQSIGRPICKMTRQNSSSDTQLHLHGGEMEPLSHNPFPSTSVEKTSVTKRQESLTYNIGMQKDTDHYRRSSSTLGYYHYQTDQSYSQALAQDPIWTFPDQGYQQSYSMGQGSATYHGLPETEFTSLRSRGNQTWHNPVNVHQPNFSTPSFLGANPYHHTRLPYASSMHSADFSSSNEMLGAHSGPVGVPILGSQSSVSQPADYQPILPTDSRYSVYYHLCALFPEKKVRAVMNQNPNVNNPKELCELLINS